MGLNFHIDGLRFTPPSTKVFLSSLNQALIEYPLPGYDISIEGGSDETGYFEIVPAQATSKSGENDLRKVVVSSNNIANLDQISFEERIWPTSTIILNQTSLAEGGIVSVEGTLTQYGVPVQGHIVSITANNNVIGMTKTGNDGEFSCTCQFQDSGTYEVKSTLNFYEKNVESQPVLVTVSSPSILPANLVLLLVGGAAILAAAVGLVLYTKREHAPKSFI
jgi:hypothetical protein